VWSSRAFGDIRAELIIDENDGDDARRGVELKEEKEDASPLCFVAETVSGLGWFNSWARLVLGCCWAGLVLGCCGLAR
jgi:hypothetical protein